jgi:hypothetical protein
MRSTLTRILVGAAIAATAVGTAVGTAGAAGATTKTHTTLSIVAARSTIIAGQTDTISGTLRAADKSSTVKKTVELKRWNPSLKKWVLRQANLTGKNGWVRFTVKPSVTSRFELVFPGTRTLAASHSGVVTIHVLPAKTATQLSIAATPSTITVGSTTKISGVLTAGTTPLPKRLVYLYRWNATTKHWDKVSVNVTGPKGGVSFTRKPPVGSVTFELVFFGSPKLAAAHSAPVTVTVNS